MYPASGGGFLTTGGTMEPVGAWLTVAERIAASSDAGAPTGVALVPAVAGLGLTAGERTALDAEVRGRTDPAAVVIRDLVALAEPPTEIDLAVPPAWSDADLDRALDVARDLPRWVEGGDAVVAPPLVVDLEALPPDETGALVADLLRRIRAAGESGDEERAERACLAVESVLSATPPQRLPVADLLVTAAGLPAGGEDRAVLVRGLALTPTDRLVRGVAEVVGRGMAPTGVAALLTEVAESRRAQGGRGPHRWWHEDEAVGAAGPDDHPAAPAGPTGSAGPAVPDRPDDVVWRGPVEAGPPAPEPPGQPEPSEPREAPERTGDRSAYVRLDVDTGTARPDVVVLDQPFEVTLGLQPRRDPGLVATSALTLAAGERVELEVVLLFDPASIEVTGSPRAVVTVDDTTLYPSVTLTAVARYGEHLAPERRLGVQLLREGQVVAVGWRTVVAVEDTSRVAQAATPPTRQVQLLELDPLLGEAAPDLVLSVSRADSGAEAFVWTAYAADPAVHVPDLPSVTTLDGDVSGFALETRRSIQFSVDSAGDYLGLAGRALRIGRAVPRGVREAIRAVVEAPGRDRAPAVLLLTEELTVPWELAAFEPALTSAWGGSSPFLGAHAAVSRWPLTEHRPRPRPRSSVPVRTGAVLTADYTGVPGWGRLENAVTEAGEVAGLFDPVAATVEPEIWSVIDLFRGTPPGDVLHVALHGQFDAQGDQEGIVLLARGDGPTRARFLTPTELENGRLEHGPFVFLNACQVGSDERVLGDYGGFASTLLRIGATAVVAPLWNVRDDVAAGFARSFYAATLSAPEPVPLAEAVRALRATYTEDGVRRGDAGLHATLVAYQVFGHPRARLTRVDHDGA
ncbi:CHAT domain-containing protein [Nocardioides donggukensis]|uniref:CHAT domain-containing protein n=1 Tax=Nocardioides donggukensis TaxID=2774019 RepID=A0A927K5B6_9ACTN|nr:CHAT domain-containing protein [Nocardioides donggukensis]MBD8870186.1 CHAT domain-containing protein [Nocardioides donggukensis]